MILYELSDPKFIFYPKTMVKLSFTIFTPGPLSKVWAYFSRFQNISEWDPNVKASKIVRQTENKIGTSYDLITLWKGEEAAISYVMTNYEQNHRIELKGQNATTTAIDEISFTQKNNGTEICYKADISLRHIFSLLTPFIKKDLQTLTDQAEAGMKKKCRELFGE